MSSNEHETERYIRFFQSVENKLKKLFFVLVTVLIVVQICLQIPSVKRFLSPVDQMEGERLDTEWIDQFVQ